MQYTVNDQILGYTSDGETTIGDDHVLLNKANDLTKQMQWHSKGFSIEELFTSQSRVDFEEKTRKLLLKLWKQVNPTINSQFTLDKYHHAFSNQEEHLKVIDRTKLISVDDFPINILELEKRISILLKRELKVHNPFDDQKVFHFRVVRPQSGDNNPLHRDVWLPDYKDCINLYIPVAGSNSNSSLILIEGSHRWSESKIEKTTQGAMINGQKFNVPAVTEIFEDATFIRPNPKPGEVLLFSPYLIHGGATNLNKDLTRISIEIRLWAKQ
jgi:hypothetical protein